MTLSNPAQYISGRTVQEQMNSLIDYVDQRAAEVATDAIASDVAQVHSDAADAHTDALAAAASAAAAAGTLANAVKKTGEASQSIAGDIAVAGALSGGSISTSGAATFGGTTTVPAPVNNTDAATKKYVDDYHDATKLNITDVNTYAVGLTGNQNAAGMKIFNGGFRGKRGFETKSSSTVYKKFGTIDGSLSGSGSMVFIFGSRGSFGMFRVTVTLDSNTHTATLAAPTPSFVENANTVKIGMDYDSVNNQYRLLYAPVTNNVSINLDVVHATLGTGNNLYINQVPIEDVTPGADLSEATI